MFNKELADRDILASYRTIRIAKEIERGNRNAPSIALKTGAELNLCHYYLKKYTEYRPVKTL